MIVGTAPQNGANHAQIDQPEAAGAPCGLPLSRKGGERYCSTHDGRARQPGNAGTARFKRLTNHWRPLRHTMSGVVRGQDVDQDEVDRHEALLGYEERAALRQLYSTAFLAAGRLDDGACVVLAAANLACLDQVGFWKITPAGQELVELLELDIEGRQRMADYFQGG